MRCQPSPGDSLPSRLFALGDPGRLGLWVFIPTPFTLSGELDEEGLARHIARICAPADCMVALGAIAEVDYLTDDEWKRSLAIAGATVPSTKPLIVGLPGDTARATRLAAEIDRSTAVAVLAPLGDADAIGYVLTIADRARRPVIPYLRRAEDAEPRRLEALMSTEVVVGLKDGLRDPLSCRRLRAQLGSVPVSAAWEDVALGYWAYGADAASPASATHDPVYARRWIDVLAQDGPHEARPLLDLFGHPFSDLRRSRPGIDIACVKHALAQRGHCTPVTRAPSRRLTSAEQLEIGRLLDAIDSLGPARSEPRDVELIASGPHA
jgi:dihydrodipicolinate synthase/N-acetylneuraminate lyase